MNGNIIGRKIWRWMPAIVVLSVMWLLWQGLSAEHKIGHSSVKLPFPEFRLSDIRQPDKVLSHQNLIGQVNIVHIWATWCSVCVQEHDAWLSIAKKWTYPIIGVVYRDNSAEVLKLIAQHDPYTFLMNDVTGKLGLELGIVGTPETYIVDQTGIIQLHHLGPMSVSLFEDKFLPVLQRLHENTV